MLPQDSRLARSTRKRPAKRDAHRDAQAIAVVTGLLLWTASLIAWLTWGSFDLAYAAGGALAVAGFFALASLLSGLGVGHFLSPSASSSSFWRQWLPLALGAPNGVARGVLRGTGA